MFADRRSAQVILAMCVACAAILLWCRNPAAVERDCCATKVEPVRDYPCAGHECGCATSEQCRDACCCYGGSTQLVPSIVASELGQRASTSVVLTDASSSPSAVVMGGCAFNRAPRSAASAPAPASSPNDVTPDFVPAEPLSLPIESLASSYDARRPSPEAPPPRAESCS